MGKTKDYNNVIRVIYKEIEKIFKNTKAWSQDDEKIIQLFGLLKEAVWQQVHSILAPQHDKSSEAEIREILAKYVVGYPDKKKSVNFIGALQPIKAKLVQINKNKKARSEYLARYLELYDDFMALASFRSLKHFAIYMQKAFNFTLWEDTMNCFEGYWYYAGRMVLDKEVKFIEKQCPTGYGKCQVPWTKVRTPNGITTLADIKVGDKIYSMDKNEIVVQTVTNKWYNRKKQVKIKTRGGIEFIASPEHRLYTQRGYVKAEDLTLNDYMYRLCKPIEDGMSQDQLEMEFATFMLFEGCCMSYRLSFTQEDNNVLKRFIQICDKLDFRYRLVQKEGGKAKEVHIWHNSGKPDAILAKYGILNCLAKHKKLSEHFLNLPLKQRFDFISIMLATDGYIPLGNSRGGNLTGVSLASNELVNGIQMLLNSCGIYSYVHDRVIKLNGKNFPAYVLQIPDEYFHIIAKNCYCYDKQHRVEERYKKLCNLSIKPYCNNTNYPKEIIENCKEFKKLVNKQFSRNKTFKRYLVEDFSRKTGLLQDIVYKDFVWEQIKSIEFIDECIDMIDIEVSNTHNFIANDIVSHNSISDAFLQAFIYGYDIDSTVLKICGNDKITDDCFNNVTALMVSPYYAKIFPYYEQFNGEINKMFEIHARKDLVFKISGSVKSKNLMIATKLSDTNGVRADYLFLDDITQRKDMSNLNMHQKDIHSFQHEWYERKAKDDEFQIVASGTTYSQFDILSHLKREAGGENAVKSPVNKYTFVSRSNLVVENGLSVFVCVPLLDYDTDESTYPQKITTTKARIKRERHPKEFWAMDMQRPMPPDSSPFYFTKLRQYTTLPSIGECGRLETCVAALDTKRRGKDYLSMPILFEANDPERPSESVFYLKDWLYDDRAMKECIPLVVSKIIQHKITRLYVERNTEECIETLLQDKLRDQGYTACVIEEVYSTEPKDRRIMSAEGDIKSKIIFPEYNMYAPSSDIGKALLNVYGYTYNGRVEHDDAPDSLALFTKRFVMDARKKSGTLTVLRL